MSLDLWIIEARNPDGSLNFEAPRPNDIFGEGAIHGMTDWDMSRVVLRVKPDEFGRLQGTNIPQWPSFIDPRFSARRKTW